jgi:hypothetical protein
VRAPDGRLEKIGYAKRFARTDASRSLFSGLAPDKSPLVMRFRNSFDISAVDLEFRWGWRGYSYSASNPAFFNRRRRLSSPPAPRWVPAMLPSLSIATYRGKDLAS